eukprot:CAMPEP_0113890628 /NCGR_PEP_ID=MMETSP0780_2-20120614/14256_1 /TAXON_ID=652834 /ORGANISM="Palpitomonas bilix" /LENGTH=259 /DNA_ID=CAMNT_0000880055 /DNA_START=99 /DNA_END=878 /DNA_ORIENTATION=+ /assembly_acc=CAM_ASM_000599
MAAATKGPLASLANQMVVIFGGSSGMGLAAAAFSLRLGATVHLVGRDEAKLADAKGQLAREEGAGEDDVLTSSVDMMSEEKVEAFFEGMKDESVNHLVITAGNGAGGGMFMDTPLENLRRQFDFKFFSAATVIHHANKKMAEGGSITLFSGALSRRPGKGSALLASCNAANEALAKALACELGPRLRVNCLSPGLTRTPQFSRMPDEAQEKMFEGFGKAIPAGRSGYPEDIGHAVAFLLTSNWVTGTVLDVDGGALVRQ